MQRLKEHTGENSDQRSTSTRSIIYQNCISRCEFEFREAQHDSRVNREIKNKILEVKELGFAGIIFQMQFFEGG